MIGAMILRVALFLIMSLGLLGFGAVAWVSTHPNSNVTSAVATTAEVKIVVAAHALRPGTLLKSDDLTTAKMAPADLPENVLRDGSVQVADLNGTMVRRSLRSGEPLLSNDILRPADHGFLAAVLGPGMRAISVAVDVVTGTAGLIWPGDHVDVLLTQAIDDASRPIGQRVAAHTVLDNIRVIAIDQKLGEGASPDATNTKPASTVTLEVSAEQAERIVVATRIGKLSLVVRSAEAGGVPEAADHVIWGGDVSPALNNGPAPTDNKVIRVYRGGADAKEFRF